MEIQSTLDSIPIDLFHEIFSRLSIKSVGRCCCVSKILASRLASEDFKQLLLTRSLTRPRLLFAVRLKNSEWVFYSSPQPQLQDPCENLSLEIKADFHTKFPKVLKHNLIYASGLVYFPDVYISTKGENSSRVICNPSTGQYVVLPKLKTYRGEIINCFGFDPIEKQFKVLLMNDEVNLILTLGTGKMRWRRIECPSVSDYPFNTNGIKGICINGVVYYLARRAGTVSYAIICFHVRTETFNIIEVEVIDNQQYQLINYKGKLGMISLRFVDADIDSGWVITFELQLRVLEDVERQEWSKYVYVLPGIELFKVRYGISVVGIIAAADEFVLSPSYTSKPFYVYYFNPSKNTLRSVKVQGLEDDGSVCVFVDHVEYLHLYDAKQFKSNVYASLREWRSTFESINRFQALCLSDDEEEEDDDDD